MPIAEVTLCLAATILVVSVVGAFRIGPKAVISVHIEFPVEFVITGMAAYQNGLPVLLTLALVAVAALCISKHILARGTSLAMPLTMLTWFLLCLLATGGDLDGIVEAVAEYGGIRLLVLSLTVIAVVKTAVTIVGAIWEGLILRVSRSEAR